jgi:hypothetical protein
VYTPIAGAGGGNGHHVPQRVCGHQHRWSVDQGVRAGRLIGVYRRRPPMALGGCGERMRRESPLGTVQDRHAPTDWLARVVNDYRPPGESTITARRCSSHRFVADSAEVQGPLFLEGVVGGVYTDHVAPLQITLVSGHGGQRVLLRRLGRP